MEDLAIVKTTPLTSIHKGLRAAMTNFAGYELPLRYKSVMVEHRQLCESVGLVDLSCNMLLIVKGKGAYSFLQELTTSDVGDLSIGCSQYTCILNQKGGIIDDVTLYRLEGEVYLMVTSNHKRERLMQWFADHLGADVECKDISDHYVVLALQGPKAQQTLQRLTRIELSTIPMQHFTIGTLASCPDIIITKANYTGTGGFGLLVPVREAVELWNSILRVGDEFDIEPVGIATFDSLRLEMGYPLYGPELSEEVTPLEMGLDSLVCFDKDNLFIGRQRLESQKRLGLTRKLVGFELIERGTPRAGCEITTPQGELIGVVSSGSISPLSRIGIGLALLPIAYCELGQRICIIIGEHKIKAFVVAPPFRR